MDCVLVWCLLADVACRRHHCSSIWLSAITHLMDNLNTVSGLLVNVAFNHHHTTSVWLSALTYLVDSVDTEWATCLDDDDLLYCGFWWFIGQHCIADFDDLYDSIVLCILALLWVTECHLSVVSEPLVSVTVIDHCCTANFGTPLCVTECCLSVVSEPLVVVMTMGQWCVADVDTSLYIK